jgi:hypothetical protein
MPRVPVLAFTFVGWVIALAACLPEDQTPGSGGLNPSRAGGSGSAAAVGWCERAPKGSYTAYDGIQGLWAEHDANIWLIANHEHAGIYNPKTPSLVTYTLPYIFHWDGQTICQATLESLFPTDDPRAGVHSRLWAIDGVAPNDLWIGGRGFTLHWDGIEWRSVPVPTTFDIGQFVVFGSNDILAVDGGLLHWDGNVWKRLDIPVLNVDTQASLHALWLDNQKRLWATVTKESRAQDFDRQGARAKCVLYLLTGSGETWDGTCYFQNEVEWRPLSITGEGNTAWVLEENAPLLGRKYFFVERYDGETAPHPMRIPDSPIVDPQIAFGPYSVKRLINGQVWMPDKGAAWLWQDTEFVNAKGRFPLPSGHSILKFADRPGGTDVWAIGGENFGLGREVFHSTDGEVWTKVFSR